MQLIMVHALNLKKALMVDAYICEHAEECHVNKNPKKFNRPL